MAYRVRLYFGVSRRSEATTALWLWARRSLATTKGGPRVQRTPKGDIKLP